MSKVMLQSLEAKLDGPEWDSSDEEESSPTSAPLVTKPVKKAKVSKRNVKANPNGESSSVIYLGHLPRDFEEREIKSFLSQFGDISNLRLSRSKRTGGSKGYAFIEFQEETVAAIVAEAMGGYFLMDKRLVCHVLPKEKVYATIFTKYGVSKINWRDVNKKQVNGKKDLRGLKKMSKGLLSREAERRKKLTSLGIDFDFPGYKASVNRARERALNNKDETAVSQDKSNAKGKSVEKKETVEVKSETKGKNNTKTSKGKRKNREAEVVEQPPVIAKKIEEEVVTKSVVAASPKKNRPKRAKTPKKATTVTEDKSVTKKIEAEVKESEAAPKAEEPKNDTTKQPVTKKSKKTKTPKKTKADVKTPKKEIKGIDTIVPEVTKAEESSDKIVSKDVEEPKKKKSKTPKKQKVQDKEIAPAATIEEATKIETAPKEETTKKTPKQSKRKTKTPKKGTASKKSPVAEAETPVDTPNEKSDTPLKNATDDKKDAQTAVKKTKKSKKRRKSVV